MKKRKSSPHVPRIALWHAPRNLLHHQVLWVVTPKKNKKKTCCVPLGATFAVRWVTDTVSKRGLELESLLLRTAGVWGVGGVEKGQEVTVGEKREEGSGKERTVQEASALASVVM